MEKRYSDRWGARLSYALGYSRGDTFEQYGTNGISVNGVQTQVLGDLNMDKNWQPAEHDRKHVLTLSGAHRAAGRDHPEPHLPLHEREPVHDVQQHARPRQERYQLGPDSRGDLHRRGPQRVHGGAQRPAGRRPRGQLHEPGRAVRMAGPRPAEGDTLDIYFDLINVLNRPNFFVASTANGNQNSGNFARYTLLRSNGSRGRRTSACGTASRRARPEAEQVLGAGCPSHGRPAPFVVRVLSASRPVGPR